jgi:hypothetical protein
LSADLQPEVNKLEASEEKPRTASKRMRWFALAIVATPLVGLALALVIARTQWFLQHVIPLYARSLDAEYNIRGRNCDVLLFGDSTALTGLDARVISRESGLKACSIAQTKGSTGVLGFQFLSRYLAVNPAPKYIVILMAPEDFYHHTEWGDVAYLEGLNQMVRHWPWWYTAKELITHPDFAFGYGAWVYEASSKEVFPSLGMGLKAVPDYTDPAKNEGHMTLPQPAETSCLQLDPHLRFPERFAADRNYIDGLRREYSKPGTTFLIDVSPIPDCDPNFEYYRAQTAGLADNTLERLPIGDYNDLDRHFTAAGSDTVSSAVAKQIVALEAKRKAAGQ